MPKDSWTSEQKQYLLENLDKQTFKDIAIALSKSELAIQLYVLRHRIPIKSVVKKNVVMEILTIKFVNPEYFHPTRSFYDAVNITQKRWWALYFGRERVTEDEYIRLIEHFQVGLKDAFEAQQLNLFNE